MVFCTKNDRKIRNSCEKCELLTNRSGAIL